MKDAPLFLFCRGIAIGSVSGVGHKIFAWRRQMAHHSLFQPFEGVTAESVIPFKQQYEIESQ